MGRTSDAKEKLLDVAFQLIWSNNYSTVSVDNICERAEVKKGSFYHFFESKADLAIAAYEEHWKEKQPMLDRMFSSQVPPLDRIFSWCRWVYEGQKERVQECGHVCGCPYASVGGEIATQDDKIRAKTEEMMVRMTKYIECAIADARRENLVDVNDTFEAAKQVYSFVLGALLQAKVRNDVEVLNKLEPTIRSIIGCKDKEAVTK
jgi:TetR/AcrR family transcriptional repressor of nem operon